MPKPYVTTKHFHVDLLDKDGKAISPKERVYTVEFTEYQDTVDLLPYFFEEGILYVIVLHVSKPALLLRKDVIHDMADIVSKEKEYIFEQPSAVIQNRRQEFGVKDTIERILNEKLPGITPDGEPELLGGSYFPSVGSSTEIVFPRAISIRPNGAYTHSTDTFRAFAMKADDILSEYKKGQALFSTRLLELVYRLAEKTGYKLENPFGQSTSHAWSKDEVVHQERFIDIESLRKILDDEAPLGSAIEEVRLTETQAPKIPFLLTTHFRAQATTPEGKPFPREIDVLIRKKIDSIDVGGYFIVGTELYMPIKWGVRPSLAVRNLLPHPVHTDTSVYFIEGIAGSLEGEKNKTELFARGVLESEEEVSLTQGGEVSYVGYDYPSAGHNPERVYRIILPLDPTKDIKRTQNEEETARIVYAKVKDIITLSHEGVIRDPRLSLNAHILKSLHEGTAYEVHPELPQGNEFFQSLVHKRSEVQMWLSKTAKEVDELLSESSLYRKLKVYGENELGVAVLTFTHEKEEHFFSPMVPVFATPKTNTEDKLPFYYLHDLFHYATAGFVPLLRTKDGLGICTFEEYMRAVCGNECEAVWYSDVLIPEEFGIDKAEAIFNGDSVARAFRELGIDRKEAHDVIREIELEGKIREEVRDHPLFGRFKGVFIGRLLRYHVMDMTSNLVMYEYWKKYLDLAKVMEDFCDVFSTVEEYERHYKETTERIISYTEGVNPLRSYLSHMLNVRIRLLALKLAYARHELAPHPDISELITEHLISLKAAYREIKESKEQLTSIDPTRKNVSIINRARELEGDVIHKADIFLSSLLANELIDITLRKNLHTRTVPFFESFAETDPETLEKKLEELKKKNGID